MSSSSSRKPRLDLDAPRYSQETYYGRLRHFLSITSPVTLLNTQKDLDEAITLLDAYKRGQADNVDEERLWRAKQIRDATLHPQTKEKIVAPARMAAFMPMNIIICYGLMLPQVGARENTLFQRSQPTPRRRAC